MKAPTREKAWEMANSLFPTDYEHNSKYSENAGYPIYSSTADGVNAWISDLNCRLEVNLPDGKTVNIHIAETLEEKLTRDGFKKNILGVWSK